MTFAKPKPSEVLAELRAAFFDEHEKITFGRMAPPRAPERDAILRAVALMLCKRFPDAVAPEDGDAPEPTV